MYSAQNGYKYGFAGVTPGILQALAMFVIGWDGVLPQAAARLGP